MAALALGALVFAVYALGACPTIYVGDSGELVTAVHLLGIPHPTGYPLYVLLGKLWTVLVPAGSVAWRMSLFSAAAAAAACGVLQRIGRGAGLGPMAAAFTALLLAFAPSFWGEANVQRVYTLNALFVALATAAAFDWHRRRDRRSLVLAFGLAGLGATNHAFMATWAVALAAFVLCTEPALLRRPWQLAPAAGAFVLGLLPYLYLPLRSRANPRLDWGDPETLGRFADVVLRRDFWDRAWIEGPRDLAVIAADYFRSFPAELTWAGAALAAVGLVAGWRRGWPVLLPVLVMGANVATLALHGSRSDLFIWHRYYIPSYAMAALLAGLGAQVLVERLPSGLRLLPLALPLVLLVRGWPEFDRSRYRIAEEFSDTLLRSLPPGAHLIATDDNILFVLMYLQFVEGRRPDVDLVLQGVGEAHLQPLRFDPDTEPVFFTHHPNWRLPALDVVPVGLVFQVRRSGAPPAPPLVSTLELDGEREARVPKDYLTHNLIGQLHYMLGLTAARTDWPGARRELSLATAAAPDNDVLFYNLGLIFAGEGLYDEALAAFRRSDEINPRHLANATKPHAADRVAETAAEVDRLAGVVRGLTPDPTLAALPPGSAAYHLRLADLLDARGEHLAAHGHRLRAKDISPARSAP